MTEVILNGTKLWEGTQVQVTTEMNREEIWSIIPPGGTEQLLGPFDVLVVDGEVVAGPGTGYNYEERYVSPGLTRATYYKGDHGPNCECRLDGWICRVGCTVRDMPQANTYTLRDDWLVKVLHEAERHWLRVSWQLTRVSHQRRFANGRCMLPHDELINQSVWHRGRTWTKWGARRQMHKLAEPQQ